jgi:prepilin-type processing-associated H-X9-DG protein
MTRTILQWGLLILIVYIGVSIFFPSTAMDKRRSRRIACMSSIKQLALGANMYAQDWDDHLPFAKNWGDAIAADLNSTIPFTCPALPTSRRFGHGYYDRISGRRLAAIREPVGMPMVFDSKKLVRNASGALEQIPAEGRHPEGTSMIGFVDGHVMWMTRERLFDLMRSRGTKP